MLHCTTAACCQQLGAAGRGHNRIEHFSAAALLMGSYHWMDTRINTIYTEYKYLISIYKKYLTSTLT